MNAGMYDPAQRPVGLLIQHGVVLHRAETRDGAGNFYLKPNGVFAVDLNAQVRIEPTDRFLAHGPRPRWATQSGPLLVEGGRLHRALATNGSAQVVRNGVGVRGRDEAFFVISDNPVSFGRFARLFRDGLGCADALYLDGVVSSLWVPNLGRIDSRPGLGPIVVVSRITPTGS